MKKLYALLYTDNEGRKHLYDADCRDFEVSALIDDFSDSDISYTDYVITNYDNACLSSNSDIATQKDFIDACTLYDCEILTRFIEKTNFNINNLSITEVQNCIADVLHIIDD